MDPSTLPQDIFDLLHEDTEHVADEANVEWAMQVFGDLLRTRLTKRKEVRGEDVLRFSGLGKPDRQVWYAANKPEVAEKLGGKQQFKFLYGDVLEVLLLFLAKETGHEVTDLQTEVEIDNVRGHTDAVIDGVPTDCKSASPFSFGKFAGGSHTFDDPFGYVAQLSGYAHALGKTERAGFLVADKVSGDICWAELTELDILGNPPQEKIKHLKEVVNASSPPPRCYEDVSEGKSGNRKLSVGCSYCAFKDDCWSDANGGVGLRKFVYSRGPTWLTKTVKLPRVDEV